MQDPPLLLLMYLPVPVFDVHVGCLQFGVDKYSGLVPGAQFSGTIPGKDLQ